MASSTSRKTSARAAGPTLLRSTFVPLSVVGSQAAPSEHRAKPDPKDGPPCHLCTGRCCKYFALPIDTPVTPEDHDFVRWYLMHEHVVVWRQEGDWYIEVKTPCKNLLADNRCAVYETRPEVCRKYGWPDVENPEGPCEFFTDDVEHELYFDSAEAFEAWSSVELEKRARRLARRRERERARRDSGIRREATA